MSLLNNVFNSDDIEINNLNKKYCFVLIIIILITGILLLIRINHNYLNSFTISNEKIVLLVEKEYINIVKGAREIIIDDIKCDYSINEITPLDDSFLVDIKLNIKLKNISHGVYKINLGKERLFEYIVRIIKK